MSVRINIPPEKITAQSSEKGTEIFVTEEPNTSKIVCK